MRKIKIHAIGNQNRFNYYIFDKKNKIIEILSKVLEKAFNLNWEKYDVYKNKKRKWTRRKINFETKKDLHQNLFHDSKTNNRIDVFYGNKKIFLTILCPLKLREKFHKELEKISYMSKSKPTNLKC